MTTDAVMRSPERPRQDIWESVAKYCIGAMGAGLMFWASALMFVVQDVPTRSEMRDGDASVRAAIQIEGPWLKAEGGIAATLRALSADHVRFEAALTEIRAEVKDLAKGPPR